MVVFTRVPVGRGADAKPSRGLAQTVRGRHRLHADQVRGAATAAPTKAVRRKEEDAAVPKSRFITGGRLGLAGSSRCLLPPERLPLQQDKQIIFVRHGVSTWNLQNRIQGSSDDPELAEYGKQQVWRRYCYAHDCCAPQLAALPLEYAPLFFGLHC
jgi:hypothetical protein